LQVTGGLIQRAAAHQQVAQAAVRGQRLLRAHFKAHALVARQPQHRRHQLREFQRRHARGGVGQHFRHQPGVLQYPFGRHAALAGAFQIQFGIGDRHVRFVHPVHPVAQLTHLDHP
jgi:hypothetical protein